jgi:predicted alpha/beta-fold hydrolase
MYHSGLTSDTRFVIEHIAARNIGPVFLVGFSLGGNVALKLAGELGRTEMLAGVCAVSTPIDLARCVRQLDRPHNRLYAWRFLSRLRDRVRRKSRLHPDLYTTEGLTKVHDIWSFDDSFTAPLFGFGSAANYYATQSSGRFLDSIRIPSLLITAKDDPLVPYAMYEEHVAFQTNPALELLALDHGGHLGFIARSTPRFWVDSVVLGWVENRVRTQRREQRATHDSSR